MWIIQWLILDDCARKNEHVRVSDNINVVQWLPGLMQSWTTFQSLVKKYIYPKI